MGSSNSVSDVGRVIDEGFRQMVRVDNTGQNLANQMGMNRAAGKVSAAKAFRSDLLSAKEAGELSDQTYAELSTQLEENFGRISSGEFSIDPLLAIFRGETAGEGEKSDRGRSRLATQKLYETLKDQPGRRQTLLTPRSNASRSIVGA